MVERIEPVELKPLQIVIIDSTVTASQGFVGKLFKVLAVDYPYGVLQWLESTFKTKHTVDLRQYTFVIPSKDYVEAVFPEEVWADTIEVKP